MKATGVNNYTKKRLKELMDEGYTAGEISDKLQVEEVSVKAWMEHFGAEPDAVVIPTMSNSKDEIIAFAVANEIDIDEDDSKADLLETIAQAE
jgi:hypothetical protein